MVVLMIKLDSSKRSVGRYSCTDEVKGTKSLHFGNLVSVGVGAGIVPKRPAADDDPEAQVIGFMMAIVHGAQRMILLRAPC